MSCLLVLLVGCRQANGPTRASVEGTVTLDGAQIDQGSIAFYPTGNTKGMVAGGAIQDGRYCISRKQGPAVGLNRVEIHAQRKTGRKIPAAMGDPGTMMDETVEAVPERYNTQSILERKIEPRRNVLDFHLR